MSLHRCSELMVRLLTHWLLGNCSELVRVSIVGVCTPVVSVVSCLSYNLLTEVCISMVKSLFLSYLQVDSDWGLCLHWLGRLTITLLSTFTWSMWWPFLLCLSFSLKVLHSPRQRKPPSHVYYAQLHFG